MELEVKLSNGWNKDFYKIIRFVFLGVSERARQLCRWDGFENVGFVILDEVKGADDKLTILRFIYWFNLSF